MPRILSISLCFALALGLPSLAIAAPPPGDVEFFEKQVRPVLVNRCFQCHGDATDAKGGLRLTSREAVLTGGAGGPAAVPGKPSKSQLIEAVSYNGLEMPPDKKLSQGEIDALARWVELGLPWPEASPDDVKRSHVKFKIRDNQRKHWSFQPVKVSAPPTVKDHAWPQGSIDRFILARLEAQGIAPSPPADKRALLRRVTFDLIGLPPTPAEVAAFLADESPGSFGRVVDRLLASPHYGERWGRHWLDVARYADTKGYVLFEEPNYPFAYTYRDYVVRSLNEDLPYDRFIREQLAADLMDLGSDRRALAALGFLTVGSRFMNNPHDVIDDRIDVVTRGLLGVTVACARCHDHKFDPIPTADYYSLYGVMASSVEPTVPPMFLPAPETEEYAAFAKELTAREQKLADYVAKKYDELMAGARQRVAEYLLQAQAMRDQPNTEQFMLLADGNDLNPAMLIRYQAYLERTEKRRDPIFAPWHALAKIPAEHFSEQAGPAIEKLAAEAATTQPVHPLVLAALVESPPKTMTELADRYGKLLGEVDQAWRTLVDEAKNSNQPIPAALSDPRQESLRQVFYAVEAPANVPRSPIGDLELLPDRPSQNERNKLLKAVEEWRATGKGAPPRAMALVDKHPLVEPYVFVRGNPHQHGPATPRQFLEILSKSDRSPFPRGSGRLDLAEAITDPQNPLTARVLVNRVWMHYFGAGLVRTPGDFGLRSEPPTHPELLDYLASQFMAGGWSLKRLHREILLSAAYQQRSDDRPECRAIDPENLLLWKTNRRRLDFEATRDALLAVSGSLQTSLGGQPFKGYADANQTRRTIYGFLDRLNMPGVLRTFDFPSPDATNPQRDTTTIAPQALFLMNNPLVIRSAERLLGRSAISTAKTVDEKVKLLYQIAYARDAADSELTFAHEFLHDESPTAAAWKEYVQGLLLANEFVFLD